MGLEGVSGVHVQLVTVSTVLSLYRVRRGVVEGEDLGGGLEVQLEDFIEGSVRRADGLRLSSVWREERIS